MVTIIRCDWCGEECGQDSPARTELKCDAAVLFSDDLCVGCRSYAGDLLRTAADGPRPPRPTLQPGK